jgi:hypothetical protein
MPSLGAYGFRIVGVDDSADWLVPESPEAPLLRLERTVGPWPERPSTVSEREIDLGLMEGAWLQARAGSETVQFTAERPLEDDELVHPLLAPAAAVHWMWTGREAMHAGAVAVGTGALLLIGDKAAGKSTTLAHLAQSRGVGVLADDLAVLTPSLDVLAGPRCIDHRAEPDQTPKSQAVSARGGTRHRQTLPPVQARARVRGWVQLVWGESTELAPLDVVTRLKVLAGARRSRSLRGDPRTLLELASLPAYRLARPRALAALAPAAELLLEAFA